MGQAARWCAAPRATWSTCARIGSATAWGSSPPSCHTVPHHSRARTWAATGSCGCGHTLRPSRRPPSATRALPLGGDRGPGRRPSARCCGAWPPPRGGFEPLRSCTARCPPPRGEEPWRSQPRWWRRARAAPPHRGDPDRPVDVVGCAGGAPGGEVSSRCRQRPCPRTGRCCPRRW